MQRKLILGGLALFVAIYALVGLVRSEDRGDPPVVATPIPTTSDIASQVTSREREEAVPEHGLDIDFELERRRAERLRAELDELRAYDASLRSDARMKPGRETIARHIAWVQADLEAAQRRLAQLDAEEPR
jgi:hypothetical protein